MEQLKEVQADKRGTEDNAEDVFISATAETEESITAIKKKSPETNDDIVPKECGTNNDETEINTAKEPEARDDKVTNDVDTNYDETELKTAIEPEAKDDQVTNDGNINDDQTEQKTATEPAKARVDKAKQDGDTKTDVTALKSATEPETHDDKVTKDGGTKPLSKDDKTENNATEETDTDFTIDDTDSYDTKDVFCKKVLQKCYSKLVSDMEPKSLLDQLFEIGFLNHQTLRDIKDIQKNSDKNRAIVDMSITRGVKAYEDLKICLQRTKQDQLVHHLAEIENRIKQEAQFRDVSILQIPGQSQSLEHEHLRQQRIEQQRPQQSNILKVMKTALIGTYQKSELLSAQFFPLVSNKDVKIDELYVKPYMKHKGTNVDRYNEIFNHDDQPNTNIYVVGETGSGKTSFCQKMISTWCRLQSETFENVSDDLEAMSQFDLLFYVSLREAVDENDIEEMIKNQLLDEEYHDQVSEVLKNERCLVILDGLDEWGQTNTKAKLGYNKGIPGRKASDNLTVLTTTRPWKLDAIKLKDTQIGARVELLGIEQSSSNQLIQTIITHLNKEMKCHKKMEDFVAELVKKNLEHFMAIPVILTQLICLWGFGKDLGPTKTVVYCQTMELLLELAQNRLDKDPAYVKIKDEWHRSAIQLPYCFDGNDMCKEFKPLLFLLSKLAFTAIFAKDKESALVFIRSKSEIHRMKESDIDICLNIGILSQSSIIQSGKSQQKLSFLHKSYQDLFAALFISLDIGACDHNIQTMHQHCTSLSELNEMETLLAFIGGMCSSDTLCRLLSYIKSKDIATSYLQNIVKNGLKEGWCCSHANQHLLTYAIDINPEDNQEHIELLCQVNTKHIRCIQMHTPPTPRCIQYIQQVHTLVQLSSQPPKPVSSRTSGLSSISTDIKNDLLSHTQNMVRILAKPKLTIESPSTASSKPSEEDIHDLIENYNNIVRILFEEGVVIDPSSSSSSSSYRVCDTDQIFFRQAMQYIRDLMNLKEMNTTFEPHSSSRLSPLCEKHIYSIVEAIQNDIDSLTERQPATVSSVSSSSITTGSSHISEDILYDIIRNNTNTLVHLYIWHITPRSKTKLYNLLRNLPHLKWLCITNATLPRQLLDSLQDLKKQRPNVWIFITNPQILPDTDCTE